MVSLQRRMNFPAFSSMPIRQGSAGRDRYTLHCRCQALSMHLHSVLENILHWNVLFQVIMIIMMSLASKPVPACIAHKYGQFGQQIGTSIVTDNGQQRRKLSCWLNYEWTAVTLATQLYDKTYKTRYHPRAIVSLLVCLSKIADSSILAQS